MAIDVGLLERAERCPPVLRLYGFSPPCFSLGLSQRLPEGTVKRVIEHGFQIIRRPSGGRAVLHFKDLTYSFVASQKGTGEFGILESSVSAAYKQICAGLKEAFLLMGFHVELGSARAPYRHLTDCFLATTHADLHYGGRKLAGSAQLRRRGAVLQHGSIPLNLDQDLVSELLGSKQNDLPEPKSDRHANLFEIMGGPTSFLELNEAMKKGFEKAFSVKFDESALTFEELSQAHQRLNEFIY